nr:MAG TPA: hypothetical protein [Caudoviricetes sp.]
MAFFFVNCGRMFADCALGRADASGLPFFIVSSNLKLRA